MRRLESVPRADVSGVAVYLVYHLAAAEPGPRFGLSASSALALSTAELGSNRSRVGTLTTCSHGPGPGFHADTAGRSTTGTAGVGG